MVVRDLDINRIIVYPAEANTPLIIDRDGILSLVVTRHVTVVKGIEAT
jgi:hypothetical protein